MSNAISSDTPGLSSLSIKAVKSTTDIIVLASSQAATWRVPIFDQARTQRATPRGP